MKPRIEVSEIRFAGRHRCPRCRMPLFAQELNCPTCELRIVYLNGQGDVMIEMVDVANPEDIADPTVAEYKKSLKIEAAGGMYMPDHLPTRASRAQLSNAPDGKYIVGFSNLIALDDLARRSG